MFEKMQCSKISASENLFNFIWISRIVIRINMIVCPWTVTLRFPVLHEKPWSLVMPQIQFTGCYVKMVLFCFQLFMSCLINLQNEQILNEVSYHHNHDNPRRQHHHHYLNRHCSRHLIYHHFHSHRCHHTPRLVISI